MSEAGPVARLAGVTHRYGPVSALDDLTLDIPAGRMIGVIEPDGVGKSTLLALVAGVRTIQQGRVQVLDGDLAVRADLEERRGRIAYMPQGLGRNLYPTLSVFENIDFHARLFGQGEAERRRRIDELLTATGLDPFEKRPAAKLSGGMKQKLSLCCALIHDPDLLVLDEPTTGVDPLSRGQFWDLIDRIRARRPSMSVIVATAYMEEAERFDWLVAMDDGKAIATGTAAELRQKTGESDLDAAFVALLPEAKRSQHRKVGFRPRTESADATPAIEAEGLTRRFGDFVAVDHVSFRIGRGEIFGFLGSNGCGKSTTMKMLTGLLPASEGTAKLFGQPLAADDMETRRNVGYMSQSFSLYGELTVRQNLVLHAGLYHLPAGEIPARIAELLARFDLAAVADQRPESLPLGIRQRLQLAVAVLHRPAMLILDEPTSGVDPVARDAFWRTLIDLSRDDGVTIFLSTHFMNEAERCDRISFMHAGKVLAVGTPKELQEARGSATLEEAFIAYLKDAAGLSDGQAPVEAPAVAAAALPPPRRFDARRLWACARRETMELLRDPIRLSFALLGPLLLMLAFGFGISFDVEKLSFAAFDQDQSMESRQLVEAFSSSRYFDEKAPIRSPAELEARLRSGELQLAIEIPPSFGRDLQNGRAPELSVVLDGAMPFRAETMRGYVTGLATQYASLIAADRAPSSHLPAAVSIETRFRYNQSFKSANAMVPSVIMLMLILIPAIMSAIGVVREKETGSIANFRSTPISRFEFLFGKQLPYIGVAMASFLMLALIARVVFDVPIKGSAWVLVLATLLYVAGTTGFGQLISSFTNTQVSAVFATAILSIVPAVNFSGLMVPVASLSGGGRIIGLSLPPAWYQPVSVGVFTKGLGIAELWPNLLVLGGFFLLFLIVAQLALRKQKPEMSGFAIHLANILRLAVKELRSIRADPIMLLLVVYTFTVAVYTVATGARIEARDLTIGIVDEDQSEFTRSLLGAFGPPLFKTAVRIPASEIDAAMDAGRLVFVLEVPPNFQADLAAGRQTGLQLNVDATAMTQAGNGSGYIQQIIAQEIANLRAGRETTMSTSINLVTRVRFNPNLESGWFASVMQILNNITLLTIVLTGAALIREREQGTVEHLLVMPVTPVEIMLAKMLANGAVILAAAVLSLVIVVEGVLGVPVAGSLLLFVAGAAVYAFCVAALGILLGTVATTMGQFGLLAIPVFVVTQLLSGATTPMESMPVWLQWTMRTLSPTPHFVAFSQGVLYRGAGLDVVWTELAQVAAIGAVYFAIALSRFRKVIFG